MLRKYHLLVFGELKWKFQIRFPFLSRSAMWVSVGTSNAMVAKWCHTVKKTTSKLITWTTSHCAWQSSSLLNGEVRFYLKTLEKFLTKFSLFLGGHVYNMTKHLSPMEFQNLKAHTIYLCEQFLNRSLQPFEREIFIYPRMCHEVTCREWRYNLLEDCFECGQVSEFFKTLQAPFQVENPHIVNFKVSHCKSHPLSVNHLKFCRSYALYQKIILRERSYGRIDVTLPHRVLKKLPKLNEHVEETLKLLYKNITAFQDECVRASLMQVSTYPLTAFYAQQQVEFELHESSYTIHLVGMVWNFWKFNQKFQEILKLI